MTIVEALRDPSLFGALPAFRDLRTWARWIVFLKALYGLPLDRSERRIFCEHTGRSRYAPPTGGYREAVCIVGRQSGKTRMAATLAAFAAATAQPEPDGTETYVLLVAQDQRAALRTLLTYARAPFDHVPVLARSVRDRRAEALTLESGCVLAAYPCRPAGVRGLRVPADGVVVCDELGFYRSSEGYALDVEMLRALRPCLATSARGKLIVLSSPYAQAGALYDLHRRHFGRDDSDTLVWQASAPAMNPTLPRDYLARMERDDPEAYRSEVLAEFRAGVATFLDPDALAACVADGVRERPPQAGRTYRARYDASGGRTDAAALGIAHSDGERGVLDVLRTWPAPHNPAGAIAEACAVLRVYGITECETDRYAAEFVDEQFRAAGVTCVASERDTSATFLEFLPLVNAERVGLLDQPELLRELRALTRHRSASGRDRVGHPPGAHDDRAIAAVGALVLVTVSRRCFRCDDPDCDGEPPLTLVGSPTWREWIAVHEPARDPVDDEATEPPRVEAELEDPGPAPDSPLAHVRRLAAKQWAAVQQRRAEREATRTARVSEPPRAAPAPGVLRAAALMAATVITPGGSKESAQQAAQTLVEAVERKRADEQRQRAADWMKDRIRRGGGVWFPGE